MIQIQGTRLTDEHGRTVLLRGVNLAGSSKIPFNAVEPPDPRFFEHRAVSFVGRLLPLAQADEHFTRLRAWGLTFLRLVVTWEALAHRGPDQYDEEYLDYLAAVVEKAGEYGFQVLIDPHQDVWSRFTGGSGAPGWTLEAVGFDLSRLTATGAALLHHTHPRRPMLLVWATNYGRLAPATMFTLFFAGNDLAPATRIEGLPAQEFLQGHYLAAFQKLAAQLRGLDCVVGYEVMNEPSRGYIGWRNLRSSQQYRYFPTPSPFEGMLLGEGIPQRVWLKWVNTERARVWRDGYECVWKQNGVWDVDRNGAPRLLRPDHFVQPPRGVGGSEPPSFRRDYYPPFAKRFAAAIRAVDPRALILVQGEPGERAPALTCRDIPNLVYAPHWYDGITLFARRYLNHIGADMLRRRLVLGAGAIQRSFTAQLGVFGYEAQHDLGGVPVLLGEFGIPFDLHNRPLLRAADQFLTTRAMDRSYRAVEANRMNSAVWNYSPDNTHARGDSFNGEDMSIFCLSERDDPDDLNSGGRALGAVIRPYPTATAGEPLRLHYDWLSRAFEYEFRSDPHITAPTEFFVPRYAFPHGVEVTVSDGEYTLDLEQQRMVYRHDAARQTHLVRMRRKGGSREQVEGIK